MKYVLPLILLLSASPLFGQVPDITGDIGERVVDLPETAGKWHVTVVYSGQNTARDQKLKAIFRSDPALKSLVRQTNFHEWNGDEQFLNKSVWREYLGNLRPAVLIQKPADEEGNGSVIYFASGGHLKTDRNLSRSISRAIQVHIEDCPRCPIRPRPNPQPEPNPVQPIPPIVPVIEPEPEPQERETYIPLWAFLLPAVGAGAGLYSSLKKEATGF